MSTAGQISVIVPTFNRPAALRRALESVLRQTYGAVELVVVDDASPDQIDDVVGTLAAPRLRVLRHPYRRGAAAARNTGLQAARGELIAFLDDDDEWVPEKLERQQALLAHAPQRLGLIYCGHEEISERSGATVLTRTPAAAPLSFVDFLRSTSFGASVPLIRRHCFDAVGGFDESLPATQDQDMWLRISRDFDCAFVRDVLVRCHMHGAQITNDLKAKLAAKAQMLRKYEGDLMHHPRIFAKHLTRLALLHFADSDARTARAYLRRALRLRPHDRVLHQHLLLSLLLPRWHRRRVQQHTFRQVDGINLYY